MRITRKPLTQTAGARGRRKGKNGVHAEVIAKSADDPFKHLGAKKWLPSHLTPVLPNRGKTWARMLGFLRATWHVQGCVALNISKSV